MRLNKVLYFLMILFFFIIVGEIAYFYKVNRESNNLPPTNAVQVNTPTVANQAGGIEYIPSNKQILDDLINYTSTQMIPAAQNNILKSLVVTENYQGTIGEIKNEVETVTLPVGKAPFHKVVSFTFAQSGGNEQIGFSFSESTIKKIKIVAVEKNGGKSQINFTDLKSGDKIELSLTSDWFKNPDDNIISGQIKKLSASL